MRTPQAQSQVELCDPRSVEQFTDVEPGDYGAAYIPCMRALGLSVGTGGTERSGLEEAVTCLTGLRVLPPGEGGGSGSITRARMAVYLIGLWHVLSGRGLPPPPPTVLRLHIAYSSCYLGERFECSDIGLIGADGTDHRQVPTNGWLPQLIDTYPA